MIENFYFLNSCKLLRTKKYTKIAIIDDRIFQIIILTIINIKDKVLNMNKKVVFISLHNSQISLVIYHNTK